jgi:glycosyltransferase involved in cell wall biosynthesis
MPMPLRATFISTAIPPFPESHTIRNVFLLRGLARAGFEIQIVTPRRQGGDFSLSKLMPGHSLVETAPPDYERRINKVSGLPLGRILGWACGVKAQLFLIPDLTAGWDQIVIEKAWSAVESFNPSVIVTSSGGFTAHVAGGEFSRRLRVPLAADLGDPWALNPIWPATLPWRKRQSWKMESEALRDVSAITVTTEATAEMYRELFPKARVEVLPMGFSSDELPGTPTPKKEVPCVTYVGVAYRSSRNLIPIFDGLKSANKTNRLEFRVVGPHSWFFERHVSREKMDFVRFVDRVPYDQSIDLIKQSDILLVVGNTGKLQVPGKALMFLGSGRPIVLVSQMNEADDPTWQILKQFQGTAYCKADKESVCDKVSEVLSDLDSWKAASMSRLQSPEIRQYEWGTVGDRYAQIISEVAVRDEVRA